MIIKGDNSYIPGLINLWSEVFGDELSYIDIFFRKQYERCETFCKVCDGEIVSAFYLLPCCLDYSGETYVGRYLYAAATKKEYRGRGIMNSLIKEAADYCAQQNIDFISLLPANEGLYGFYAKFGFYTAMYRYKISIEYDKCNTPIPVSSDKYNIDNIVKSRKEIKGNKILFSREELEYIITSMSCYNSKIFCDNNELIIYNEDERVVEEFIGEYSEFKHFKGFDTVYSAVPIEEIGINKKEKYGMIYPINDKLGCCSDIYMNLALD